MFKKCPVCEKSVPYYNPRVGRNRITRYCPHKDNHGNPCKGSGTPTNPAPTNPVVK